ncbi:dephospho-CoA kinase [bacterium]|nr:MAG: dephospho-CoA kinase [bacterium]
MYLIGITGPIASGKTSVAKLYREMGAYLLDADKIGHQLLQTPAIKKKVVEQFGKEILNDKGKIDRETLGPIVFEKKENLNKLNDIIEKPLTSKLRDKIIELEESGFPGIVAVDAALLPKWDLVNAMDMIVLVEAPRWQRMNRLVRQLGYPQEEAERRIEAQEHIFKKFHPKRSIVVKNNGDFVELHTNAMKIWLKIKELAREKAQK